jgi:hypothetical protein
MHPDQLHGPPTAVSFKKNSVKLASANKLNRKSGIRWREQGAPVQNHRPWLEDEARQLPSSI